MKFILKNIVDTLIRRGIALRRPSRGKNRRLLAQRSEDPAAFVMRDATKADIPALAVLHAKAWHETYRYVKHPPTAQLREQQWQATFQQNNGSWFCLVIENQAGELIGFAKGQTYAHVNLPQFSGELNKLYLLSRYQQLGLGRKLINSVATRFLAKGIPDMVLFSEPQNPSCGFYDAMGGKRLYAKNGEFHGGYGWDDLSVLIQPNQQGV